MTPLFQNPQTMMTSDHTNQMPHTSSPSREGSPPNQANQQQQQSPKRHSRPLQRPVCQQQPQQPQLNPDILARMAAAQGTTGVAVGVNGLPIRVASVQDFRRSMNSLNTVPESSRQQARHIHGLNQTFALNQQKRANTNTVGNRPMGSDNPLLKMMEERMAAKQKEKMQQVLPTIAASPSPELPPMSNENKTALQWSNQH